MPDGRDSEVSMGRSPQSPAEDRRLGALAESKRKPYRTYCSMGLVLVEAVIS